MLELKNAQSLDEFAFLVLQAMSFVADADAPVDLTQDLAVWDDRLECGHDGMELVDSRHDSTLQIIMKTIQC